MDTRVSGPKKSVVVIGGGVAGLTAADELIRRGFDVHLYERRPGLGGKARSVDFSADADPDLKLPAEHGFRFFPGFYKHVIASMQDIPCEGSPDRKVSGNLEGMRELRALGDVQSNPVLGVLPLTPLWRSPADWAAFLPSFLDVSPIDGKRRAVPAAGAARLSAHVGSAPLSPSPAPLPHRLGDRRRGRRLAFALGFAGDNLDPPSGPPGGRRAAPCRRSRPSRPRLRGQASGASPAQRELGLADARSAAEQSSTAP